MAGTGTAARVGGGATSDDVVGNKGGVPPHAADEVGAAPVLEPLPEDVEPGHRRTAAALPELAVPVQHRQLQPWVGAAMAGGPHHAGDARGAQVEGPVQVWCGDGPGRLRGEYLAGQAVRRDVLLDGRGEPVQAPVPVGEG